MKTILTPRNALFAGLAAAVIAAGSGMAVSAYDDDSDSGHDASALLNASTSLSLTDAIAIAENEGSGKVLEIELEMEDGTVVYEAEVAGADGTVSELLIDANTGEVSAHVDDGEDDSD